MGFLRKEWDYENPAEHSMEAHDAYRDEGQKDSKPWLWVLALICGAVSVYSLYYVENTIYGGVVKTNWAGWMGLGAGMLTISVIHFFKPPKEPAKLKWDKGEKITGVCVLVLIVVLLFWLAWSNPQLRLYGFQILILFPLAIGLDMLQKHGMKQNEIDVWNLIMTFVLLAVVTLVVPRLAGIWTVTEAEGKLAAEGYYVNGYENAVSAIFIDTFIPSATVELDSDPWNDMYYLFSLDDGYVVVEPWSGKIIAE